MFNIGRLRVIALALADALCVAVSWTLVVLGYWLLGRLLTDCGITTEIGDYHPENYLALWPVIVAFLVLNACFDLYQGNWTYPSTPCSPIEEFRRLVLSSAAVHLGVLAFLALRFQTTDGYSRVVTVASGVLVAMVSQSFRNWMRSLLLACGIGQIPVVLTGGGEAAFRVAQALTDNPYFGLKVVGYFDGTKRLGRSKRRVHWRGLEDLGVRYLGTLRDAVPEARKRDIKILIACQDQRLFQEQMKEFAGWFTYIEYMPTAQSFPIFGSKGLSLEGLGGLEMVNQERMKMKRLQKRIFDDSLAFLVFIGLLPLFLLLPLLIKLTSRGPVFYRQQRLGRDGKPIRVWKFRSMYRDADERLKRLLASDPQAAAEWRQSFKLRKDPRVTLFGRFLRKTSLDELPQLFNVLSGDMALIGPRPIVAAEVPYYGEAYRTFASVRPGVTGLWQVSGRSDTDYTRRVALDVYYVLNWSPWMDIWIALRTVYAVILMRGAR